MDGRSQHLPRPGPLWSAQRGPVAYLRVYEPLAAFEGAERIRWERYAHSGNALDRASVGTLERAAAVAAVVGVRPAYLPIDPGEVALVRISEGVTRICPLRLRLRACEALLAFRAAHPASVADAFAPAAVTLEAEEQLAAWRVARPDGRLSVEESPWAVPVQWFVIFHPSERRLIVDRRRAVTARSGGRSAAPERSLVYLTSMARARRRLARALAVLRRTMDDTTMVRDVERLGRWLEEFHPRSEVELDYGGIVDLIDDDDLHTDDSAGDVEEALGCLSDGDSEGAAGAYRRVVDRWRPLGALEAVS